MLLTIVVEVPRLTLSLPIVSRLTGVAGVALATVIRGQIREIPDVAKRPRDALLRHVALLA
jgi:hypothetical protein